MMSLCKSKSPTCVCIIASLSLSGSVGLDNFLNLSCDTSYFFAYTNGDLDETGSHLACCIIDQISPMHLSIFASH